MPSAAIPATAGMITSRMIRACTRGVTTPAGEYAPMPPVFGPSSPSRSRLWSWLEASGGNAVTGHECLGEMLGALELRCRACRPEDPQARGAKRVDDAGG